MDQDPISNKAVPVQQTSPEEDAALLAIEALEAQSVDLDTPKSAPAVSIPTPAPKPTPIPPKPTEVIKPVAVVGTPAPAVIPKPVAVAPTPKPEIAPQQKKPSTPAEEIAEALSSDTPGPKRFQFFINQKPPRLPFVIGGIVAVVVGLGVAAYFTLF